MSRKVLVVAAHPDDEIIGCGGTIAKMAKQGDEIYTLILGEATTSRKVGVSKEAKDSLIDSVKQETLDANKIVWVKGVFFKDFPDNRFDSVPFLDIVKKVEEVKENLKPEVIFTHYEKDLNIDHRITCEAVLTATRPIFGKGVKEIYSFEVLSSTEWNFPLCFSPDTFIDITETLDLKVKAMESYKSELRKYPHPRSVKGIKLNAEYWGMKMGIRFAEAFKLVRMIK